MPEQFRPLRRFDLDSGKELAPLTNGKEFPNRVLVSPDGETVLSTCQPGFGTPYPNYWVLHDPVTGKRVTKVEFESDEIPAPCAFVGPRAVLAFTITGGGFTPQRYAVSRWNLDTMKCEWKVPTASGWPVLSPDGKRLASSSGAHIILHDAATGKRLDSAAGHVGSVGWVGFSPDGRTVTTVGSREIMKWSLSGERKSALEPPEHLNRWASQHDINPLAWVTATSLDGKQRELVSWDFEKDGIAWRMPLAPEQVIENYLFSHDGKRVVTLSREGNTLLLSVRDGPTGKKLHSWSLKQNQGIVRLSVDGKTLFVHDEVAGLDVETGKETVRTKVTARDGTLSPDGTRLAHARRRDRYSSAALVVYDTKTAKKVSQFDLGEGSTDAMTLTFSATGKWVAVRTGTDVLVCDVDSTSPPRKLDAHSMRPTCLAFSPNNATLAVGYEDGTTLLWDLSAK